MSKIKGLIILTDSEFQITSGEVDSMSGWNAFRAKKLSFINESCENGVLYCMKTRILFQTQIALIIIYS